MEKSDKIIWSVILTGISEVIMLITAAFIALIISGNIKPVGYETLNIWLFVFIAITLKIISEEMRKK